MEGNDSKRYYPMEQEHDILTGGIAQYFSYAERSPERSSFAAEISAKLQKFSNHWTKRAVRLWFTNNKSLLPQNSKTAETSKDYNPPIPPQVQQPVIQPAVHFNIQQVPPQPTIIQPPPMQQFSAPVIPQPLPPPPPPQTQTIQQMPKRLVKPPPEPTNSIDFMAKLELQLKQAKDPMADLSHLSNEYDMTCTQMHQQSIDSSLDNVQLFKTVKFPKKPESYGTSSAIWQPRAHKLQKIIKFDTSYTGKDVSMYVHSISVTPERALSYETQGKWQVLKLGVRKPLESIVGNQKFAFIASGGSVLTVNINSGEVSKEITISQSPGIAPLSLAGESSAVAGFSFSPLLYLIRGDGSVDKIETGASQAYGVSTQIVPGEDLSRGIFCAFSQSTCPRLISSDGRIMRYFLGHTDTVSAARSFGDIIITASDDKSCKLWDVRTPEPQLSLLSNGRTVTGLTISERHAVLCTDDHCIYAYDTRAPAAVLGIHLDEYDGESPYYDEATDEFRAFGIASKDGIADSTLFIDDNMENSKYVILRYSPFLSCFV